MADALLTGAIKKYVYASSTDSLPTLAEAQVGSLGFDTDTRITDIWNGASWQIYGGMTTIIASAITLGAGATTFAVTTNYLVLTGDGGGNTIATITGGVAGDRVLIEFADSNVTIAASAGIRLQGGIASPANDFGPADQYDNLELNYTSEGFWNEVCRSLNSA